MSDQENQNKVSFVTNWIEGAKEDTVRIRKRWREQRKQFREGSEFVNKEEWQSNFSLGKLSTRIRAAAARARNVIISGEDWFNLKPVSTSNEEALLLAPIWKKLIAFELNQAKLKRKIGRMVISAHTDMCSVAVNREIRLIQNPDYVEQHAEKEEQKQQAKLAEIVENPQTTLTDELSIQQSFEKLSAALPGLLSGGVIEQEDTKPFIQVSGICIDLIDPQDRYWDDTVQMLEESEQVAYEIEVPLWKLRQDAERGFYDKEAVKRIVDRNTEERENAPVRDRYTRFKSNKTRTLDRARTVKLQVYFGPYTPEDKVEIENWGCIVANESELIKEWKNYPLWEPPGHKLNPIIDCVIKEVPHEATGEGIGVNAVHNERWFDSNINLANDAMRLNVGGVNVVDYLNLVDQQVLESGGIAPGQVVEVRGNPKDVFHHINLTNNVENQFSPINELLLQSLDEHAGVNEQALGGPTRRSRVTASETRARQTGQETITHSTAIDIEQQLLIPLIEKVFARILQFQVPRAQGHPGYRQLLSDEELRVIQSLGSEERLEILNSWYQVEIEGFSNEVDRNERIDDYNEIFAIVNQGGPLSQLVNLPELFKDWLRLNRVKDIDRIILPESELGVIQRENQLLVMSNKPEGRYVDVSENDNHEMHIQSHQQLMQSGQATPALQAHLQEHVKMLQQRQPAPGQQPGQPGPPQNGQGGLVQ